MIVERPIVIRSLEAMQVGVRQPVPLNQPPAQQVRALMASDDIKSTTGIYDASLGARGNETSGKAIIARQRQGDVATFIFTDNQVRAIKYTGKILVDLIPKIYDTERVVRLMGDDLRKSIGQNPAVKVDDSGMSAWAKINVLDPVTGNVVANDLSVGRYDVVVDAGPGYQTKRIEAADGMIQLSQAAPQFAPILIPEIAKNLDWPGAQEIADKIEKAMQPPQQPPDPMMQAELQDKQVTTQGKQIDNAAKAQGMKKTQHDMALDVMKLMQPQAPPQMGANGI